MSIHLKLKTKWRWVGQKSHCFVRADKFYVSFCGKHDLDRAYGGSCRRPPPMLRCGVCDGAEMDAYGWEESGPDSKNWEEGRP